MNNFILSDSPFNDTAATSCHILRGFFTSSKQRNKIDNLPLNILSESLKDTSIFVYDNPILLSLYPNGLVTETLILLPVEKFQSVRENLSSVYYNNNLSKNKHQLVNNVPEWSFTLGLTLLKNLELKLNIVLPEEETNLILEKILINFKEFNTNLKSLDTINHFKEFDLNLPSIKNEKLFKDLEKEDLFIVSILHKMINSSEENTISFKHWILKFPELYDNLPNIKKSITEIPFEKNKDFNITELNQNIIKYKNSECSIFKPLLQMATLIDKIKKESNNDFDILLNNLQTDLFPSLFLSNDYLFNSSLHYLRDSIFSSNHSEQEKVEKLCNSCYDFYKNNKYQRDCLIEVMTYFDTLDNLAFEDNKEILDKKIILENNNLPNKKFPNKIKF